jgi:glucose-1-phosphate cytidylyltransferase
MKVVLFCGGLGTRLREHSDTIPKPLVPVGHRPILWHLMRYYAHFGHTEFILCLGYRGDLIRNYFLEYDEALTNDFTFHGSDGHIELHSRDVADWKVTFVDTGLHSNIGERLMRVRRFVENEEMFLANYADGLSNLPLDQHVAQFSRQQAVASLVAVPNPQSLHAVLSDEDGLVTEVGSVPGDYRWVNGGFFVLRPEIFRYMEEGDELVEQPFRRLIHERRLTVFRWGGFWQCMDTFKDKISFDRMEAKRECPWMVWDAGRAEKT